MLSSAESMEWVRLTDFARTLPDDILQQVADAGIRWLSTIAKGVLAERLGKEE